MAKLYFKVASDWEEVVRLRNEIAKLKQELKGMDGTQTPAAFNTLNAQLSTSTKRMYELVTEAAKAGAEIEGNFKRKIFDASQTVNGFTEKIIAQKTVVKDVEADVKRLGEAYRTALKNNRYGGSTNSALAEYNAARRALDEEKAALFALTQEQANARLSVKKLRDEYALYRDDSKEAVVATEGIGISLKKAFAVFGGAALGKQLISDMVRVRGEFQAADTAIQTLLGGEEKANALISEVREYAKISPLEFSDVTQATQMMLGFNIEAEKVPRFLSAIGDVSMGDTQKFNSLTLAFSQMSAAGKLMGQDLNQMINAGFNPLQIMSEKTGKSIAQLKEEMSKGAISAEMVQQAFIDATSAGGKFYQMSENASKTINGQLSMMQDAMDAAFNEMGQKSEGFIMSGIQMTTTLIENYETVGKVLAGLVVTYGTYKAALITNIALTKSWAVAARTDAVAKGIQTAATKAATIAQASFNAVANANPYVLLTTTVVGLSTALWAFTKTTNQAAEAQKRLDEATANMRKEITSEQADINILFNDLKNAKEGTNEYRQAKDAILNKYGKYLEGLNEEIRTLKNVKGAYDAITAAAIKAARARGMETAMRGAQEAYGETYSSNAGKLYDELRETVGDTKATSLLNKLQKEINNTGKASQKLRDEISDLFIGSATYGKSKAWITGIENAARTLKDETKKIKVVFGDVGEQKDGKKDKEKTTTYQEDLDKAKTEWDNAKKELAKIEKDKSKFTSKQYEDAKKRKETAEKAYKDLGGIISTSSTSRTGGTSKKENRLDAEQLKRQQSEYSTLLDKQREERIKKQRDNEYEIWQNEIDLMEEGNKKVLAQIELDYERQMAEIEDYEDKLKQEKIEAAKAAFEKNPANKGKVFDVGNVDVNMTEQEIKLVKSMRDKAEHEREQAAQKNNQAELEANRKAWQKYFIEFGNYQEKRKNLIQQYDDEIAKLKIDSPEYSIKVAEKNQSIEQLDEQYGKSTKAMADLFEDASNKSVSAIQSIIDKYETLVKYMSGSTDGEGITLDELKEMGFTDKDIEKIEKGEISIKDITDAIKGLKEELKGKSPWQSFVADLEKGIKSIKDAGGDTKKIGQGITDIGNSVKSFAPALSEFGSNIANIFGFDDSKITGAIDALGGLGQTAAGVGQIMSGDIVGGAMSAVSGISSVVSALDGLFGADYSHYNQMVEEYNQLNEIWDELIDKKLEYIGISYGAEANKVGKEALELAEKSIKSYRILGKERLNAGASAGSHSIGVRMRKGMSKEGWNELRDAAKSIGFDYSAVAEGRMTGLFDLTAKQLDKLKQEAPTFWAKMDGDVREYLENIIEGEERIQDIQNQVKEQLTQVSFDSVFDSFVDMLMDMDSSAEDFSKNFEQYMQRAILTTMVGNKYKDKLQAWYDSFAKANDDKAGITKEEMDRSQAEWDAIVAEALAEREALKNAMGWTSSSSQQTATSKGFQAMSQDTGEELNGRFTALQIAGEEIKTQNVIQSQSLNILTMRADDILSVQTETRNIASDMRDIIANSYLELVQISENTGNSAKYLKDIKADIAEVKRNTSRL